jgi:hypothetical protein
MKLKGINWSKNFCYEQYKKIYDSILKDELKKNSSNHKKSIFHWRKIKNGGG